MQSAYSTHARQSARDAELQQRGRRNPTNAERVRNRLRPQPRRHSYGGPQRMVVFSPDEEKRQAALRRKKEQKEYAERIRAQNRAALMSERKTKKRQPKTPTVVRQTDITDPNVGAHVEEMTPQTEMARMLEGRLIGQKNNPQEIIDDTPEPDNRPVPRQIEFVQPMPELEPASPAGTSVSHLSPLREEQVMGPRNIMPELTLRERENVDPEAQFPPSDTAQLEFIPPEEQQHMTMPDHKHYIANLLATAELHDSPPMHQPQTPAEPPPQRQPHTPAYPPPKKQQAPPEPEPGTPPEPVTTTPAAPDTIQRIFHSLDRHQANIEDAARKAGIYESVRRVPRQLTEEEIEELNLRGEQQMVGLIGRDEHEAQEAEDRERMLEEQHRQLAAQTASVVQERKDQERIDLEQHRQLATGQAAATQEQIDQARIDEEQHRQLAAGQEFETQLQRDEQRMLEEQHRRLAAGQAAATQEEIDQARIDEEQHRQLAAGQGFETQQQRDQARIDEEQHRRLAAQTKKTVHPNTPRERPVSVFRPVPGQFMSLLDVVTAVKRNNELQEQLQQRNTDAAVQSLRREFQGTPIPKNLRQVVEELEDRRVLESIVRGARARDIVKSMGMKKLTFGEPEEQKQQSPMMLTAQKPRLQRSPGMRDLRKSARKRTGSVVSFSLPDLHEQNLMKAKEGVSPGDELSGRSLDQMAADEDLELVSVHETFTGLPKTPSGRNINLMQDTPPRGPSPPNVPQPRSAPQPRRRGGRPAGRREAEARQVEQEIQHIKNILKTPDLQPNEKTVLTQRKAQLETEALRLRGGGERHAGDGGRRIRREERTEPRGAPEFEGRGSSLKAGALRNKIADVERQLQALEITAQTSSNAGLLKAIADLHEDRERLQAELEDAIADEDIQYRKQREREEREKLRPIPPKPEPKKSTDKDEMKKMLRAFGNTLLKDMGRQQKTVVNPPMNYTAPVAAVRAVAKPELGKDAKKDEKPKIVIKQTVKQVVGRTKKKTKTKSALRKEYNNAKKDLLKQLKAAKTAEYKELSKKLTGTRKEKAAARKELKQKQAEKMKKLKLQIKSAVKRSAPELKKMLASIRKLAW